MTRFVALFALLFGACALQASSIDQLSRLVGQPVAAAIVEFQAPDAVSRNNAEQKSYALLWRRLNPSGGSFRGHVNPIAYRFTPIVDAPRENMPGEQMRIVAFERPTQRYDD
jgi:hypothetical protein